MKILITGIGGFVGKYLADYCLKKKCDVYGMQRPPRAKSTASDLKSVRLVSADLTDYKGLARMLHEVRPDWIFHLAAQSMVPLSWKSPQETLHSNAVGQANLFEAIRELGLRPRIHVAGSSEEYGLVRPDETPIKEDNPLRPLSPYAVSKVTQDLMAYQYYKSYDFHVVRTRAFNHTGPRRSDAFVISSFAKQIAVIERDENQDALYTGNLEARRDFTDVRDMVRAYWLTLEKGEPGEVYNISSGKARRVGDVLKMLIEKSSKKIEIRRDPGRLRLSDVPLIVGDSGKFRKKTGWRPLIPFEQTLDDLLNYWREIVAAKKTSLK